MFSSNLEIYMLVDKDYAVSQDMHLEIIISSLTSNHSSSKEGVDVSGVFFNQIIAVALFMS
jgi:hypothetical protein